MTDMPRPRRRPVTLLLALLAIVVPPAHGAGGETCATATAITSLPFDDTGDTTGHANDRNTIPAFCSTYVATSGPDLVYRLDLGVGNSLSVTVDPAAGYDTSIYLFRDCGTGEQCIDGADDGQNGDPESFSVGDLAPGTYFLWVDAFYEAPQGEGSYTVSITGELGSTTTTSSTTSTSTAPSPTSTSTSTSTTPTTSSSSSSSSTSPP
jgi:hypothetical protein